MGGLGDDKNQSLDVSLLTDLLVTDSVSFLLASGRIHSSSRHLGSEAPVAIYLLPGFTGDVGGQIVLTAPTLDLVPMTRDGRC